MIDSEELILEYFWQIYADFRKFSCHENQSNCEVWTKIICLVENQSSNNSEKVKV